jgi:hypothetical protein
MYSRHASESGSIFQDGQKKPVNEKAYNSPAARSQLSLNHRLEGLLVDKPHATVLRLHLNACSGRWAFGGDKRDHGDVRLYRWLVDLHCMFGGESMAMWAHLGHRREL